MSGADPLKAATERKPVVDSSLFSDLVAQLAIPDDSTGVSVCCTYVHLHLYVCTSISSEYY